MYVSAQFHPYSLEFLVSVFVFEILPSLVCEREIHAPRVVAGALVRRSFFSGIHSSLQVAECARCPSLPTLHGAMARRAIGNPAAAWQAAGSLGCLVFLCSVLPMAVEHGFLPDPAFGWESTPDTGMFLVATTVVFSALCILERATLLALDATLHEHDILGDSRNRCVLARMAYTAAALIYISFLGCSMASELKWMPSDSGRVYAYIPFELPAAPYERVYSYLPRYVWACAVMGAFQAKNLIDTLQWGDGPEYVLHHLVCIYVAYGCVSGQFLHLYGIFFFGLSEISTALVTLLACFDEKLGVPALGDRYPLTKIVTGLSFAVSFVVIRVIIWPYLAYCLTLDCLAVLAAERAHSPAVVYSFLGCLFSLTCLQFFWLTQIVMEAGPEIKKALGASQGLSSNSRARRELSSLAFDSPGARQILASREMPRSSRRAKAA
jgi:hypothetical protein